MIEKTIIQKNTGTYEWVTKTFNIQEGCPYNCKYPCYARLLRRKLENDWENVIFKEKWFFQKIEEYPKGFLASCMCFSAHDIYPSNQNICLKFMLRVLEESKNTILITTKANLETIKFLCENLKEFKSRISFMITITSQYDAVAVKYEPEAPFISERFDCLEYLSFYNWEFNVNIEPFLDKYPFLLIKYILRNYTNVKTIWLGCNSRKDYEIYSLENLDYIFHEIMKYFSKDKVYLKNSFMDKYKKKLEANIK